MMNRLVSADPVSTRTATVNVDAASHDRVTIIIKWTMEFQAGCKDSLFTATSPNNTVINSSSTGRFFRDVPLRTVSIDASGFQVSDDVRVAHLQGIALVTSLMSNTYVYMTSVSLMIM